MFSSSWVAPNTRGRRLLLAVGLYLLCTVVFALVAGPYRLSEHTPYNHYALLANAWLHGRQSLPQGPPAYTMNNDFAVFEGATYISFPPFPALLMLPFVWLAGRPEAFQDGRFVIGLAGGGPALLFLILEALRRRGDSLRSEREHLLLSLLFAFGTVYFFTAAQGTVWFAGHVITVCCLGVYLLCALDARHPWLAGLALACAWMTRPTALLTSVFFGFEALQKSLPTAQRPWTLPTLCKALQKKTLCKKLVAFCLPLGVSFALASWMNWTRFHSLSPFAFGHEHLAIYWQHRIAHYGLFGYHYLAKNLGVALTSLPWLGHEPGSAPFRINEHGLALWFTTPLYLWLLRPFWSPAPRDNGGTPPRTVTLYHGLLLTAALPACMNLLYQNSGWRQFGYRFSNDYALVLFLLLALQRRPFGRLFPLAAAWSIAWNLFGAVSFDRTDFESFYFREGSQSVLYDPD